MAPQLWIVITLFTILLIAKLLLIARSKWYDNVMKRVGGVEAELFILTIIILINLFAIYGLNCSIKGDCYAYSYIIIAILVITMLLTMYADIINYKHWQVQQRKANVH
jgi:hypothetical protein